MNEPVQWSITIPLNEENTQYILTALQELILAYPPVQEGNDPPPSEPSHPPLKDGEAPF